MIECREAWYPSNRSKRKSARSHRRCFSAFSTPEKGNEQIVDPGEYRSPDQAVR